MVVERAIMEEREDSPLDRTWTQRGSSLTPKTQHKPQRDPRLCKGSLNDQENLKPTMPNIRTQTLEDYNKQKLRENMSPKPPARTRSIYSLNEKVGYPIQTLIPFRE